MERTDWPPAIPDSSERVVDKQDVVGSEIKIFAQNFVSHYDGLVPHSELITRNDLGKLVIRYDILNHIDDDGTFRPEEGRIRRNFEIRKTLIIYEQRDGKFAVTTKPKLEL